MDRRAGEARRIEISSEICHEKVESDFRLHVAHCCYSPMDRKRVEAGSEGNFSSSRNEIRNVDSKQTT